MVLGRYSLPTCLDLRVSSRCMPCVCVLWRATVLKESLIKQAETRDSGQERCPFDQDSFSRRVCIQIL